MYTNFKRRKAWLWAPAVVITLAIPVYAQNSVTLGQSTASVSVLDSTKDQDGLVGSVRRVKIQSAKVEVKSGHLQEGPPQLLEITTYGLNGNRIDNASYPVAHSSGGKEEYKYNDRGNIIEMTLRGNDGSILSREKYEYEFDTFGNWRKMITSLVIFENGELKYEPVEVTYREIAYYYDDSVAKIVKPGSPRIVLPTAARSPEIANAVSPDSQVERTISDPTSPIDAGGEPPKLSEHRKKDSGTSNLSNAESEKVSNRATEPAPISVAPAKDVSAPVKAGKVSASKGTDDSLSPARRDAVAYYEKGREFFGLGALKEAIDSYQRSIELEPRSATVYLSLGHAYLRLKNNQEAGKAFKKATVLDPDMAEAHYGLGLHYFGGNRYKNAADAFKRATLLRPDMAKAHYGLALAYQELGKLDDLVAEFRILETLDRGLAKKLSDALPESNLPCRVARNCK